MQPNQQSVNILVVFHPMAHCTPVPGHNGPVFSSWKFRYFKGCERDRNNKL